MTPKKFYYSASNTAAIGQFSEKWLTDVMSETASDTEIPMTPKDALEAWGVQ